MKRGFSFLPEIRSTIAKQSGDGVEAFHGVLGEVFVMEIPLSDSKERYLTDIVQYILGGRKQVTPKMILQNHYVQSHL